jgi:hypothetical protein
MEKMNKLPISDSNKRLKEYSKILRDAKIVLDVRIKFGTENNNDVLNHLISKYGEEKGNNLVEKYWNSSEE